MKILLTGYSGFIGSHLVDILKDKYDLKLLGRTKPTVNCDYFKSTIDSNGDYSSLMYGVDVVIHLAARAHIMNDTSTVPLEEFREVNLRGTLNIAKQAAQNGVKRFIYISSVKVLGEKTSINRPFINTDIHNPLDAYGISKSEAECQLGMLTTNKAMDFVIIRPPLVYGKGVKANFASLMKLVSYRIPLPFGAINFNKRSLVSVYNLVDLINVCIDHPNAANQIFLVSDDEDISTSEMVALMAKVQGFQNYSLPLPVWCFHLLGKLLSKQDVIDRLVGSLQVDITHTKNTLNWTPPFSIEEGFAKCIERSDV
jgi:UDP-glucose 4-epimerase